eukprot:evm.model.NODE_25189_length_9091_cov_16.215488.1
MEGLCQPPLATPLKGERRPEIGPGLVLVLVPAEEEKEGSEDGGKVVFTCRG